MGDRREADGQLLSRLSLYEQRAAIEAVPGSAGSPQMLEREPRANLSLHAADLELYGPMNVPFIREYVFGFAGALAANFGIICASSPLGFRFHQTLNLTAGNVAIARFADLGAVLALAGFAASPAPARAGFNLSTTMQYLVGNTTVGGGTFARVATQNTRYQPNPWLWVPPGAVLALWSDTANVNHSQHFEITEPITRSAL